MPKRLITALVAALALLAAPRRRPPRIRLPRRPPAQQSQDDGSAAKRVATEVKAIYTDYSRDGEIDVCEHSARICRTTLDTIEPDFDSRLPRLPRGGRGRHPAPRRRQAATPTRGDSHADRHRHRTAATATASPDDGALPAARPDDGSTDERRAPAARRRHSPPPDDGRAARRRTAAPPYAARGATDRAAGRRSPPRPRRAVPTPVIVATSADRSKLLIPGILIASPCWCGPARRAGLRRPRSPRMRHAWNEAGIPHPRQRGRTSPIGCESADDFEAATER